MKHATAALAFLFSAQGSAPARPPLNRGIVEKKGLDPADQAAKLIEGPGCGTRDSTGEIAR